MSFVQNYSFAAQDIKELELPFKVKFSFEKLYQHWNETAKSKDETVANNAKAVLKVVNAASPLKKPFEDVKILEKYEKEIRLLMQPLFPSILALNEIKAGTVPFQPVVRHRRNMPDHAGDKSVPRPGAHSFCLHGVRCVQRKPFLQPHEIGVRPQHCRVHRGGKYKREAHGPHLPSHESSRS